MEWTQSTVNKEKEELEIRLDDDCFEVPVQSYRWSNSLSFSDQEIKLSFLEDKTIIYNPDDLKKIQVVNLKETENGVFTLSHTIEDKTLFGSRINEITYDLLNQEGDIVSTILPTTVEEYEERFILTSSIDEPLVEEALLFIRVNVWIEDVLYRLFLTPLSSTNSTSDHYQPTINELSGGLLNQNAPHLTFKKHQFFAESLHLTVQEKEDIVSYQFVSPSGKQELMNYSDEANKGISLKELSSGNYFIYLNEKPIYVTEELSEVWYTVQRKGKSKKITLTNTFGLLGVSVEEVETLPEDVYDLVIDPGHGGEDGGAAAGHLVDDEEVLKLSLYLKERFEEHGLKVKLTRETDIDPAQQVIFNYETAPYVKNGRVDQVYRYQAKYTISNHLNAVDGDNEGVEVYSSIVTNDGWSRSIINEFKTIDRIISSSDLNHFEVSEGSYKRYYGCPSDKTCLNPYIDYLYIIRETGGSLTYPITLTSFSSTYSSIPTFGSETILVEYAYLDHPTERKRWVSDWEEWAEVVIRGTLNYLDIPYIY